MQATPDKSEQSRFRQLQSRSEDHPALDLPPVDAGAYLLGYLQELDYCQKGEMGLAPLSFQELSCWQWSTGLSLSPWEVLTLRRLSIDYIDQLQRSRNPAEPAPHHIQDLPRQREAVFNFFKQLARRKHGHVRSRNTKRKGHQ